MGDTDFELLGDLQVLAGRSESELEAACQAARATYLDTFGGRARARAERELERLSTDGHPRARLALAAALRSATRLRLQGEQPDLEVVYALALERAAERRLRKLRRRMRYL
ncbi:hypothetical protein HNR42_003349 [Deinobacterium chartae]|uniref:Uncharacterized protein n=1 Tax=Deinobacterium chartae TaxID=521158 RepID=A0A841I6L6_9DEIO|nr:hypothetical protein [Deinobacterium chartae]MBB6099889.1 hypothetical protein [Deinobacterium chartae]